MLTVILILAAMVKQNQMQWVRILTVTILTVNICIAGTMMAMSPTNYTFQSYYSDLPQNSVDYHSTTFAPRGSSIYDVIQSLHIPKSDQATIVYYEVDDGDYLVTLKDTGENAVLKIPRYHYDNYFAYDLESGEEFALQSSEDQTIEVIIPEGYEGTVQLSYIPPISWRITEVLSIMSIIFFAYMYFRQKGESKKHKRK